MQIVDFSILILNICLKMSIDNNILNIVSLIVNKAHFYSIYDNLYYQLKYVRSIPLLFIEQRDTLL
jgi:hypothetical protein